MNQNEPGSSSGNWLLLVAALLAIPLAIAGFATLGADDSESTEASSVEAETELAVEPTVEPTIEPTVEPTVEPTIEPTAEPTVEPTIEPTVEPTVEATVEPTAEATPEPTTEDTVPDGSRASPDDVAPDDAPEDVERSLQAAEEGSVVESQAVVLGGRIFLFGAVPSAQAGDSIVELAGSILGPENVYNFYVIDSRAASADDGNIRVDDTVLFETNSAVIAEEFFPLLNQAVALMSLRPDITMTIIGHTDSVGSQKLNQALSTRRAESVVSYLIERGIEADRLRAKGKGESRPVADNETAAGRQLNRRIQVTLENVLAAE